MVSSEVNKHFIATVDGERATAPAYVYGSMGNKNTLWCLVASRQVYMLYFLPATIHKGCLVLVPSGKVIIDVINVQSVIRQEIQTEVKGFVAAF